MDWLINGGIRTLALLLGLGVSLGYNLYRVEAVEKQQTEMMSNYIPRVQFEEFRHASRNDQQWMIRELNTLHRKIDRLLENN